ncbi:Enoyl-CoA hydratase/carnithine racemase [Nocardioides terrae]|uniref:Enoyl-CoA hydratase/carnithine racemase n=1 Tax=Nocardioides terrae TaxID=574651 RepID=A0A1I1N9F4_9ACTN|nr:enoyl-CoA hydratase-related protein [Nocardioides terrae]SFC93996.1 Enoyl-CoA hydratase/carnithine racemase [Nocardioides terrae]
MPTLANRDGVHVLHLGDDENRLSPDWIRSVDAALDEVVESPAPLVTIGGDKFYSTGLDFELVQGNPDEHPAHTRRIEALLARVLTLPVPTVAAVSGHAFGAGAMLAASHDWRVMRADRGYFCLPEVDLGVAFSAGMVALLQAKLTPRTAVAVMTTGQRFTGTAALAAGIVDDIAPAADLLGTAVARVRSLVGKDPEALGTIKATMYAAVVERLAAETTFDRAG